MFLKEKNKRRTSISSFLSVWLCSVGVDELRPVFLGGPHHPTPRQPVPNPLEIEEPSRRSHGRNVRLEVATATHDSVNLLPCKISCVLLTQPLDVPAACPALAPDPALLHPGGLPWIGAVAALTTATSAVVVLQLATWNASSFQFFSTVSERYIGSSIKHKMIKCNFVHFLCPLNWQRSNVCFSNNTA